MSHLGHWKKKKRANTGLLTGHLFSNLQNTISNLPGNTSSSPFKTNVCISASVSQKSKLLITYRTINVIKWKISHRTIWKWCSSNVSRPPKGLAEKKKINPLKNSRQLTYPLAKGVSSAGSQGSVVVLNFGCTSSSPRSFTIIVACVQIPEILT